MHTILDLKVERLNSKTMHAVMKFDTCNTMISAIDTCYTVIDFCPQHKAKILRSNENKVELMFEKLFELEPAAQQLFKHTTVEDRTDNSKFTLHAHAMIDMIDCAVSFMDSDLDVLKEDLARLKREHFCKGVRGKYLAKMEKAVLETTESLLKSKFTRRERTSWQEQSFFTL